MFAGAAQSLFLSQVWVATFCYLSQHRLVAYERIGLRSLELFRREIPSAGNCVSRRLTAVSVTTMSPSLPPEILDLIIGHLDDKPTFNACCLVSKSWVPRARRHLFAHIEFTPWGSSVRLWMEAFPVPSTSPTHYTRSLWLTQFDMADAVSLGAFTWIHQFRNIVELRVRGTAENGPTPVSLAPLHGLSPTLKLLHLFRLSAKLSELLNLICSFPLLEDLWLHFVTTKDAINTWNTLSTLPRLTGKLSLLAARQINPLIHGLLAIPSGPHFTRIVAAYPAGGSQPTNELISRCSDTLESLTVIHNASSAFHLAPMSDWC